MPKFSVRIEHRLDESLESYLLRLGQANYFESYQLLSRALKDWLYEHDEEAFGAFPLQLKHVNVFHASQSSGFRVRALRLLDNLADTQLPLLQLALLGSSTRFCFSHSSVFRQGTHIPLCFVRKNGVPICPECLKENAYIPQVWHLTPYTVCHKHQLDLIDTCPSCGVLIDYCTSESITECECGFDLRNAATSKAGKPRNGLSGLVVGELDSLNDNVLRQCNQSTRFGALLWYHLEFVGQLEPDNTVSVDGLCNAIEFFNQWPKSLHSAMNKRLDVWDSVRYTEYNHTPFRKVFGDVLLHASGLPSRQLSENFVLRELVGYLSNLIEQNPKTKKANVGDILLTLAETSALLSTSYEQVDRLYQEGFLKLAYRPHQQTTIPPHKPAFRLRNVIELGIARMQTNLASDVYLPAW